MPSSRSGYSDSGSEKVHFISGPNIRWKHSPPRPASQNLRGYLRNANLPSISRNDSSHPYYLPLRGRRSHKNRLRVRIDPERHIDEIRQHEPKSLNDTIQKYHKRHIYGDNKRPYAGKYYRRRQGEALVLKSSTYITEGTYNNTPYPCSVEETCTWLTQRPFKTMQRAMHLAYPDTTRWWVEEAEPVPLPEETANRSLWRTYLWRFHPDKYQEVWWSDVAETDSVTKIEPAPRNSMAFIIQPPWILALQDLKNFTNCKSVPSLSDDGTLPESRLNCSQRIWANLLDTCKRHNCHSFAITTYQGWAFGSFSEGWTSARISEMKDFDETSPNVMQSLVYWVACSMGLAGAQYPGDKVEEAQATS